MSLAEIPIKRGDIVLVDLRGAVGGEKMGVRPCVVVQNEGGNTKSPLTIVAPITDDHQYKGYATQVRITAEELGPGGKDSIVECGHLRTIDRDARITAKLSQLKPTSMSLVDKALRSSLGLR